MAGLGAVITGIVALFISCLGATALAAADDLTSRQELLLQSFSDYALYDGDGSVLRWEAPAKIRIGYLIDADSVDPSVAPALAVFFSDTLPRLSDVIGKGLSATRDDAEADIVIVVMGVPDLARFHDAIERVLLGRVDLGTDFALDRQSCLAYERAQDDRLGTRFVPNIGVALGSQPLRDSPMQLTAGILIASALKGSDALESCISGALPRLLGLSGAEITPSIRLAYGAVTPSTKIDPFDLELLRGLYRTEALHSGDSKFRATALYKQYLMQNPPPL